MQMRLALRQKDSSWLDDPTSASDDDDSCRNILLMVFATCRRIFSQNFCSQSLHCWWFKSKQCDAISRVFDLARRTFAFAKRYRLVRQTSPMRRGIEQHSPNGKKIRRRSYFQQMGRTIRFKNLWQWSIFTKGQPVPLCGKWFVSLRSSHGCF